MQVERAIVALGGIATAAELDYQHVPRVLLDIHVLYGRVVRIRHGIFALPGLPPQVLRAITVGGRLGCVSALAHHGATGEPALLHVTLERGVKRLRSPDDPKVALDRERDGVVLHWTRNELAGTRLVIAPTPAARQAARCKALTR